ncbi:MAG TPA: hypothetical protein VF444_15615 [Pseudonocardiaceae bacterium]
MSDPRDGDSSSEAEELAAALRASQARIHQHHATLLRLIAELDKRPLARARGYRDTAGLLEADLVITREAACRLVHQARSLSRTPGDRQRLRRRKRGRATRGRDGRI